MSGPSGVATTDVWRDHPTFAQLLGLCPLLAVTTSVARAVGLAVATALVLIGTSLVVALLRRVLVRDLRLMSYVLVVGTFVSIVDFTMRAWFDALHAQLGIFVPLIASNCVIMSRIEACAARTGAARALLDALSHSLAVAAAFLLFGALRELLGRGTLFAGIDALEGGDGGAAGLTLFDGGILLVTLTPGAFLVLAFVTALHRRLSVRTEARPAATPLAEAR
jgi:electron transport complex protein RnfE